MKTTLNIDQVVMARLKQESARRGRTMSELVEAALRRFLDSEPDRQELPALPQLSSGGSFVDVSNRETLYEAMGER
ncbi:MAG TPA: ribbon-helix-helix protein, CopG family [Egibacteraceae bacterium]|nr:ribbon-helix-helix protein, CopG family [Actinomycetota bacterium]HWB72348.1 ribbon-helix-helix protein, CopG family [Egibacteraceae bacterium]